MKNLLTSLLLTTLLAAPVAAQSRAGADTASDRARIDVDLYSVDVTLDPEEHRLAGKADIQFKQLDRKNVATFDLDRRLRVEKVTIGGADTRFRQYDSDSTVEVDLSGQQLNNNPVVHIEYAGILNPEDDRRDPVLAKVEIGRASVGKECRSRWSPYH